MWTAVYSDGARLEQFSDNKENLFKDIELSRVKKFIVRNDLNEVILDLESGEFKLNGQKVSFSPDHSDHDHRLIYFRRVRRTMGIDQPSMIEHLGWQTTIQGGNGPSNIKRIIGLTDEVNKFIIRCD